MPSWQVDRATDHSTTSASMPVNRSRNSAGRDGYTPTIHAAGSNGTAATTWGDECPSKTLVRSNAGKQFAVTCASFNWPASPVICGVADGSGRRYSIGPMTAANSDRHGHMMEPRSNLHRGRESSDRCGVGAPKRIPAEIIVQRSGRSREPNGLSSHRRTGRLRMKVFAPGMI